MNILVSIVSDQTIPNIEFIKEKYDDVDQFAFISSKYIEKKGCREWILDTLDIPKEKVLEPIILDPFSFYDIESKLNVFVKDENHYIVNLTGGTKLTTIFVHDYFKNQDAEMYYLTGKGAYIRVHPGRQKAKKELNISLSLKEYLTAHGVQIKKESAPLLSFQENEKLLEFFLNRYNPSIHGEILETLRLEYRGKKVADIAQVNGLSELLHEIEVKWKTPGKLNKYEVKSLTGEWLEEYLYQFILREYDVDPDVIGLGLQVEKGDAPNELDVLLMKNNKLYLFECKTSIYEDLEQKRHLVNETIYKSDSLRHNFGLFTNTSIVTLSDLSLPRFEKPRDRAKVRQVKLLDINSFKSGLKLALDAI